jgi:hypothetical protein
MWGSTPALSLDNFESVPPGNWGRVESLAQGEEISIKMLFGDTMQGRYLGLGSDSIRLNIEGEERVYQKKYIAEIRLMNVVNDSNQNGVFIGALIGSVPLAIYSAYLPDEAGPSPSTALIGGIFGGSIGGLIGYLVDNTHKGNELIYRAPDKN